MKYDTAGNEINEISNPNCDCGLTCGCKKCRIFSFKIQTREWLKEDEWGFMPFTPSEEIDKETEKNFYKRIFETNL